ncbi:hypothetical protein [Haladaptatus sp. DYF46]|uniref:hypothetical protein n=1 Tax=Haladaptatus sp. DYF46 TaxID=2886041 RepID=UPI001E33807D|nr:hypothetical protein [Haladaptatus sp. DYF46]
MVDSRPDFNSNLDWISRQILAAIHESDGTADTSEIKAITGVTEGTKVPYRLKNKLAPDFVDLMQPEMTDDGQIPPKVATLTADGEDLAEAIVEEEFDTADLSDDLENVKADVSRLAARVDDLENGSESTVAVQSEDVDLNELNRGVEKLLEQMTIMNDYLNEKHDGELREFAEEKNPDPSLG